MHWISKYLFTNKGWKTKIPMERYVISTLKEWVARDRRKPLLLRGARQVGKTWLVEELAMELFENLIKIDFEENPGIRPLFDGELDPEKICAEIEIRTGQDIIESKTLLFFDEIQACPRAILALRYFYEKKPGLHVMAAGSLLEFAFSEISFPVGRIQSMEIHPMNFSEFLLATGNEKAASLCQKPIQKNSDTIHNYLTDQLRIYWLVGGMPECVKVYSKTKSIKQAIEVQDEIIETYRMDFHKYKPKTNFECLMAVFSGLAGKVGQQIKYTTFSDDYSIPTLKKAFESLLMARIAKKVKAVSTPGHPMEFNASDKKFKSVFLDIGLMNRVMGIDYSEVFNHGNLLSVYKGQLAEQFVGQELLCAAQSSLYYWSRNAKNSNAEIDFLLSQNGNIIPLEVKEGPAGKLKSMHMYVEAYKPKNAVVFYSGNVGKIEHQNIHFLPLYYTFSFAHYGISQ